MPRSLVTQKIALSGYGERLFDSVRCMGRKNYAERSSRKLRQIRNNVTVLAIVERSRYIRLSSFRANRKFRSREKKRRGVKNWGLKRSIYRFLNKREFNNLAYLHLDPIQWKKFVISL